MKNRLRIAIPLACVAIIATVFLVPNLLTVSDNTPEMKTRMRLEVVATVLSDFKDSHHRFPNDAEGIASAAALKNVTERSAKEIGADGWGRPFVYRLDSRGEPTVYSRGQDGLDQDGAGDDILMPPIRR